MGKAADSRTTDDAWVLCKVRRRHARPDRLGLPTSVLPLPWLSVPWLKANVLHWENVMLHNKIMKILQIKDVFERPNKTYFLTQCDWNAAGMIRLGR